MVAAAVARPGDRLDPIQRTRSGLAELPIKTAKMRNDTLIPLRGVLEFARRDHIISENPAALLGNAPVQIAPPDPFTLEQVDKILDSLAAHYDSQIANYYEAAFFTGMRPSEQIAVWWSDLDEPAGELRIQRARAWGRDKSDTKTHTVRDIELSARAVAAIARQKQHTLLAGGGSLTTRRRGAPGRTSKRNASHGMQRCAGSGCDDS